MKKILLLIILLVLTSFQTVAYCVETNETISTQDYKNVIVFIGDGMGPNHVDAGGIYLGSPLCFDVTNDKWAYHAYSNTDSRTSEGFTLDETLSLIRPELNKTLYDGTPSPYDPNVSLGASGNITCYTDSAAGGTALSTGVKVTNSRIGMDIDGSNLTNLVEIAKGLNMKAGVVTSDEIVGATPASYVAHAPERHEEATILKSMANSDVDLLLGKNCSEYKNNQTTYESLFTNAGFSVTYDRLGLDKEEDRIIGLFPGVTTKPDPRTLSLAELTVFALDYLDNEEGFFLMVEGANIDKKSHSNQTQLMLNELLGFNEAVMAAEKWASDRNDTLIVVTADHETGGLYFDRETTTQSTIVTDIKWLTQNHSRTRVDIAVYGDISEFTTLFGHRFKTLEGLPYWDNTDVFRLCSWYLTH